MSFHEIQFDPLISYGSAGGPGQDVAVVETDGGLVEVVVRTENARRRYNAKWGVKSRQDLQYVQGFYIARRGPANGFRYKDWLDFNTTADHGAANPGSNTAVAHTDQVIGTGDGSTTQFRLLKRYVSGATTVVRYLTKPVAGTVKVGLDAVLAASGWTVDTTTGLITFTSAPGAGVSVTAGCEFDVPVMFSTDVAWPQNLAAQIEDFGWGSVPDIPLVELPDGLEVDDDVNCGGAQEVCLTASYQAQPAYARAYIVQTNAAGLSFFLPDTAVTPSGLFGWVINQGPNSIAVKPFGGGSTLATVASGSMVTVFLTLDAALTKTWLIG